jgi:hypothetical protein
VNDANLAGAVFMGRRLLGFLLRIFVVTVFVTAISAGIVFAYIFIRGAG